jgi:signal transduction histidine kinase
MLRSGWFERRLLIALVLFALTPTLFLVGLGTVLFRESVSLQATPAGWERLGETGRVLLEHAEASADPVLVEAAERHRSELTTSIQQAQRWGYLNRQFLEVIPWLALVFLLTLGLVAVRSARWIAKGLARPIDQLVGWSGMVARGEPLPAPRAGDPAEAGEFGVLRQSFRQMASELEASRARALEAAGIRASVALARGVAHELKNALTPLRLAVRTLRSSRSLGSAERESLEVVESESERLDGLARAFSQFGRPPEGAPSQVDLGELLTYLARTHVPEGVEVDLDLPDRPIRVDGYYAPLSRAFANLIINAAEAMGEAGGVIEIQVARRSDEAEVRILDEGPGLPPDLEDRIFDPDFTTKARGTGLGLALVRQTIHAHGGTVEAGNRLAGGAEFVVTLPAMADEAEEARDQTSTVASSV